MSRQTNKEKEDERDLKLNPVNVFTCDCGGANEWNKKDFMSHLKEAHKLNTEQLKGKKRMIAHIDGSYWFSYNYSWELESGLKFSQYVRMARSNDDHM